LVEELGVEAAYAYLSFARRAPSGPLVDAARSELGARLPQPEPDGPYLELELTQLPPIEKPKVAPKRLSTGETPLEIVAIGSSWRISCTGCGEASPLVRFRWQALE